MSDSEIAFKPDISEYYSQFPNPPISIVDVSFFTDVIDNLTRDLAEIGVSFYYIKWTEKIHSEEHVKIISLLFFHRTIHPLKWGNQDEQAAL